MRIKAQKGITNMIYYTWIHFIFIMNFYRKNVINFSQTLQKFILLFKHLFT